MIAPCLASLLVAFAVLTACLGPLTPRAHAQQATSVEVDIPQRIYTGETALLNVTISGDQAAAPTLPAFPGFTTRYLRASTLNMILNGVASSKITHQYAITAPSTPGTYTLPAFTLTVNGRSYPFGQRTVVVADPSKARDFLLTLQPDRTIAYVGQPIAVDLVWTIGRSVRNFSVSWPVDGEASIEAGPDPRPPNPSPFDGRYVEVQIDGRVYIGTVGENRVGDRAVRTLSVRMLVIPSAPGQLKLGPARITADVPTRERRDVFGFVDDMGPTERQFTESEPVTIDVRPLPQAGRPANFSGLVGSYSLDVLASPTQGFVGDPIDLRISITGPAPLRLVPPLDLSQQRAFARGFKIPREPLLPQVSRDRVEFQGTVRPRDEKITALGPIELNYFDPDAGEYKTLTSPPIELRLKPTIQVTLPSTTGASNSTSTANTDTASNALPEWRTRPPVVLATEPREWNFLHPAIAAALALPPALCLLSIAVVRVRRGGAPSSENERLVTAARRLRRALKRRSSSPSSSGHLRTFAAEVASVSPHALTDTEAARILRSLRTPASFALASHLDALESQRFGVASGASPVLDGRQLAALAASLERELLTRRVAA